MKTDKRTEAKTGDGGGSERLEELGRLRRKLDRRLVDRRRRVRLTRAARTLCMFCEMAIRHRLIEQTIRFEPDDR